MTAAKSQGHRRIQEESDGDRTFVINPVDNDLFTRTGKQVIEHCRLGISIELWCDNFRVMLEHVAAWIKPRKSKVRACYCIPQGSKINLFFSPSGESYDFELGPELAVLNQELIQRFNVGSVEVRQIPFGEIDRFVNIESARLVYGEHFVACSAVEAQP